VQGRSRLAWLVRAQRWGRCLEDVLIAALLAGLILLASAQIFLRNALSIGLPWADGLVRLTVLWLALLGAIAAGRDRRHIAVDVLGRNLPPQLRRAVDVLTNGFAAIVTGLLARYSWAFVEDSRAYGDVLVDGWPAWMLQLILPVGFGLLCYRYVVQALQRLAGSD
jgi:TRAP-type C4-dicarboxylate transport system permease small subunit